MILPRREILKGLGGAWVASLAKLPLVFPAPGEKNQGIRFTTSSFLIDGVPTDVYSGEIHYFRTPRAAWRRRMELLKSAGGNCVATYIPWMFHEPREGTFDYGQEAITDFLGYLDAASAAGLYVIARPGPYQYSELKYSGLPAWLFKDYPQVRARRSDGRPFGYEDSVSYLHPVFLEKVKPWFDSVCPLIAKHTVAHGGPIALTQIDNELTGIHLWFDGPDYHPETMGFGKSEGRYARFLQARFASVAAMNADYGTQFASFAEAVPRIMSRSASTGDSLQQQLEQQRNKQDYFDFYLSVVAEYASTLAGWMRSHGIDTPLTLNSGPNMTPLLVPAIRAVGGNSLLGSDHYYTLDQTWAQNNPTPQLAAANFCSLESLRLLGFPPTVFELQGGSSADWPPITAQDARTHYWTNLAFGMKGSNYYVFTGGPNPPGAGTTGDSYDYGAAVGGVNGDIRPLYKVESELGQFQRANPWLASATREYDCRLAYDFGYARSEYTFKERGELPLSDYDAFEFFRRGVLTTALCASLSPSLCDLDSDAWIADTSTPVAVVSSACMSRAKQLRLVAFLRSGGRMLLAPILPVLDERFWPCEELTTFLGLSGARTAVRSDGTFQMKPESPTGAVPVTSPDPGNQPWLLKTEGGGEVIFLGKRWNYAMRTQATMMLELLARLGLKQRISCSNGNLWTSLRTDGQYSVLFAMNLFTAVFEAEIICRTANGSQIVVPSQKFQPMSVEHFVFRNGRRV